MHHRESNNAHIKLTVTMTGQMAFKKGLFNISGVHSWKDRAINSSVSARAAGFLFSIAVTSSSWILLIEVYTTMYSKITMYVLHKPFDCGFKKFLWYTCNVKYAYMWFDWQKPNIMAHIKIFSTKHYKNLIQKRHFIKYLQWLYQGHNLAILTPICKI